MTASSSFDQVYKILDKYSSEADQFLGNGRIFCHRPHVAPLAYLHYLYPAASEEQIAHVAQMTGRQPRPEFRDFLNVHNGFNLFNGSILIHGIRANFDRTDAGIQWFPYDLWSSNILTDSLFGADDMVIGGIGPKVDTLVLKKNGQVDRTLRRTNVVIESWSSLSDCILTEVSRYDDYFTSDGKFIDEVIAEEGKAPPFPDIDLSDIPKPSLLKRIFNKIP